MRVLIVLAALVAAPAPAALTWGPYVGQYVKNYDGDTVTLKLLIWPDLVKTAQVRILGIDAPEVRGECDREKRQAREARDYLADLLTDAGIVRVTVHGFGKFGRPLADLEVGDRNVGELMIDQGHARRYDGGARASWCDPNA